MGGMMGGSSDTREFDSTCYGSDSGSTPSASGSETTNHASQNSGPSASECAAHTTENTCTDADCFHMAWSSSSDQNTCYIYFQCDGIQDQNSCTSASETCMWNDNDGCTFNYCFMIPQDACGDDTKLSAMGQMCNTWDGTRSVCHAVFSE